MCHVLIIEDEPLVAMEIQDILAREGATSFEVAATKSMDRMTDPIHCAEDLTLQQ